MLSVFESILPIFLLIVIGNLLRRLPVISPAAWPGFEQLNYWFLYPVLLFITIVRADFSALSLDAMLAALIVSLALMVVLTLALWPPLRRIGAVASSQYSSVFQTSLRWNGFMALAVAEKIFPPEGAAVVALVMAIIIAPINVASVTVVTRFADRGADWRQVFLGIITNPLILASAAAIIIKAMPFELYGPIGDTLQLAGRASLGMGLIVIGASLRPTQIFSLRAALWIPVAMKLMVFPLIVAAVAMAFGIGGAQLSYLMLCAAVPTATNGYVLARQLGGDAELYAEITTLQTALAFVTIPIALTLVGYAAAG